MKKGLKIFLGIFVVLLIGLGGTAYYYLKVKEYDIADEKVEEITESDYQIELPGIDGGGSGETAADDASSSDSAGEDSGEASDQEGTSGDDGSASTTSTASASGDGNGSSGEKKSSDSNSGKKAADGKKNAGQSGSDKKTDSKATITAESIKAAYRPVFESLESQANGKIDGLVSAAYSEYKSKKESGESVSITYFYRKYTAAGQELESKTDETFQYVYNALEKDLEKHGFSASEASEFKTQYESAKEARQSALLEKAKSAL